MTGTDQDPRVPNPYHDEHWQRIYALWLANADDLPADLGDRTADNLLAEARKGQMRQWDGLPPPLLLVVRRPMPQPT